MLITYPGMNVDSTGKVGIGTASPTFPLEVVGASPQGDVLKIRGTGSGSTIIFFHSSDVWSGTLGLDNSSGALGIASVSADAIFYTNNTSSSWGNERMRISQSTGNVGIGTPTPGFLLDVGKASVVGAVANFTNSTGSCNINPTGTALSCSSDERLKKDIEPIQDALGSLAKLEGVSFRWKNEFNDSPKHIGFIAQKVEKVFPEFVTTDQKGFRQVNYIGFVSVLTNGIKELYAKYTATENRVERLERENAALKAKLDKIEQSLRNTPGPGPALHMSRNEN